jgi:UvrD-like helicase family protein
VDALGTVERFCYSADEQIGGAHVPPVNGVDPASFAELTWRIVPWAERAWHDIRSLGGSLPLRHDHYLKLWQLTRPRINADYLMFDEAQDANPVTAAIVQNQRDMQLIAVGDSCHAIYGWRGAVDALAT